MTIESPKKDTRLTEIAMLAFLLAPGRLRELRAWLDASVPVRLPADIAYEIVLQSYLFFGYAQAIEAAKIFSQIRLQSEDSQGSNLEILDRKELVERGEALCSRIYAPNFERLVENMGSVSPELADWMVVEGYGRVLSRPGPSEVEREVASVVFLVCSGHSVQLYSHVRGARNLGVKKLQLEQAMSGLDFDKRQRDMLDEILEKVYAE